MNLSRYFLPALLLLLFGCASNYRPPVVRDRPEVPNNLRDTFRVKQGDEAAPAKTTSASKETQDSEEPKALPKLVPADGEVTLDGVLESVEVHYPDLAIVRLELAKAEGQILAAEGAFDTLLNIASKNKLTGFYQHQILDASVERRIDDSGVLVQGGYRFGLGDFASYDGDIQTNSGGEFFFGVDVPILQGNTIDKNRAKLFKARLKRDATDPLVHEARVGLSRKASGLYWKCVAAAQKVQVAKDLLALAETRRASIQELIDEGEKAEIDLVDNDRLIADRQDLVVAATRDFERSVIALSLYFRDNGGNPIRAELTEFPIFPAIPNIAEQSLEGHIQFGLRSRPELRLLEFKQAMADVERERRENDLLPKLNLSGTASQDVGSTTDTSGSDDEFEFGIGLKLEVPLARRFAKGRLAETRAMIAQIGHKARLQADKIENQIRDAASAYRAARQRLVLSQRAAELAGVLEQAERDRFDDGASDLLRINLREQTAAKARSDVINATAACFVAFANYRAAMGLPAPPK